MASVQTVWRLYSNHPSQFKHRMPFSPATKRRLYREKHPPKASKQKAQNSIEGAKKNRIRDANKRARRSLGKALIATGIEFTTEKTPSKTKLTEAVQGFDPKEVLAVVREKISGEIKAHVAIAQERAKCSMSHNSLLKEFLTTPTKAKAESPEQNYFDADTDSYFRAIESLSTPKR
mmetsp:Transcript_1909/g.4184  ORF Transcript_1909/g.4184 Transcript_1909/m.4184 type:complete len:176 (-) Transcript_1909:279-806(-)